MAERSQYQYQPLTGPVWSEPVASRMQWLPQGREFARGLAPNRLGDFAQPFLAAFTAVYDPKGLQWLPSDRYAGKPLQYSLRPPYTVAAVAFDPEFFPFQSAEVRRILAPRTSFDWSVYPQLVVVQAYDPQKLEWQARDSYRGRLLDRSLYDRSIYPLQPPVPYDPRNLEWLSGGNWQPARSIAFIWQGSWVCDPTTPPDVVPPQPSGGGGGILGRAPEERAQRQLVIAKRYVEQILGEEADETDFLESVTETLREAEQPGKPQLSRELGALSALDAITHAYNVHFETLAAARAAIEGRLVELEDDDLMAVLMILAMADEP